jgi:hypothetical protein
MLGAQSQPVLAQVDDGQAATFATLHRNSLLPNRKGAKNAKKKLKILAVSLVSA